MWILLSAWCKQNMKVPWKTSAIMNSCCETSSKIITPSWLLTFIWKYIFLNNLGAFKGFRIFYGNVRLNVWIQFSQIKEKSIFFNLWRWEVTLTVSTLFLAKLIMKRSSNRPFLNFLWPPFQNEAWCSTIHIKMNLIWMWIKLI